MVPAGVDTFRDIGRPRGGGGDGNVAGGTAEWKELFDKMFPGAPSLAGGGTHDAICLLCWVLCSCAGGQVACTPHRPTHRPTHRPGTPMAMLGRAWLPGVACSCAAQGTCVRTLRQACGRGGACLPRHAPRQHVPRLHCAAFLLHASLCAGAKEKEAKMGAKGVKYEVPAQYKEEGEGQRSTPCMQVAHARTCMQACTALYNSCHPAAIHRGRRHMLASSTWAVRWSHEQHAHVATRMRQVRQPAAPLLSPAAAGAHGH